MKKSRKVYTKEYVRCCETTKNFNVICLETTNKFEIRDIPMPIEYCPWCGKLLDTNLIGD